MAHDPFTTPTNVFGGALQREEFLAVCPPIHTRSSVARRPPRDALSLTNPSMCCQRHKIIGCCSIPLLSYFLSPRHHFSRSGTCFGDVHCTRSNLTNMWMRRGPDKLFSDVNSSCTGASTCQNTTWVLFASAGTICIWEGLNRT